MADWFDCNKHGDGGKSGATTTPLVREHDNEIPFCSRRSPVIVRNGCVASSQSLASSIGVDLLKRGANAAEASIAVSAVLGVTEPCSGGLGGDMFCLYYDSRMKRVSAINGSGHSPQKLTLDVVRKDYPAVVPSPSPSPSNKNNNKDHGIDVDKFRFSAHAVTVPGTAIGYEDLLKQHGSGNFTLSELLEPAAKLAEEGFPVAGPITAYHWKNGMDQIKQWLSKDEICDGNIPFTVDGRNSPNAGDIFINKDLANVLRELGSKGADGFYGGFPGRAIVDKIQKHGGVMSQSDLVEQKCTFPDPINVEFGGKKLYQVPPNGQGIAGLIALKGLSYLKEKKGYKIIPGTADCYHAMIEMMRLGFADARAHVTDSNHMKNSCDEILNTSRIENRVCELFDPLKAKICGTPDPSSCTVSFQVVDGEGNAISFVNSNYMGFGTGMVPAGCGFTLQNRGFGFNLEPNHPNVIAPRKRPCHTIIPAIITHADTGELYATISNMGGNMQPQGHLQHVVNMIAGGMCPQQSIDFPRFCIPDGSQNGIVQFENEVNEAVIKELIRRGHILKSGIFGHGRALFGRAQIIKRNRENGVLWAGSDGRADGCAIGY